MNSLQSYRVRYVGMTENGTVVRVGMCVEAQDRADAHSKIKAHSLDIGCVEMHVRQLEPQS